MNVNFTPQAVADLSEIHRHIAQFDRNAADRILSRIRQVIEIFESFPLLGREGSVEGTREFAISGLPYTIVYRIASAVDLDILTVIHQRKLYPPQHD
ncbi:type II toxin-antitoxin system RelE/ParE family toxin [Rhizobium sp. P32RR-XVIII]|uniref:type II toxin-antitoxin system RelE/ParE family toxin n=1 Tax=Rhizobium sp. P32RR-XVIII TaxID=2726738 RepID=UPI0014577DF5|nr:type II toxin-antitoxin system RelE/ParE family toxin [Rhizobium sp. P32RR-XVIII]NLS03236.1 type II toxin-antitoxin system RelE/ParE family toxin [Rhizobium sp. P32RR-XVIII]